MNWRALMLAMSCAACGFGRDVQQVGNYESVPSTYITDSALYPLSKLLIVEQDTLVGQTRFYVFKGNLRAADLGFQDLRRIGAQFGAFAMAFERPREHADMLEAGDGALEAQLGAEDFALQRIDDDALDPTQARRYLASVSNTDYQIDAYFGATDSADTLPALSIAALGIDFDPSSTPSSEPELKPGDARFELAYISDADYLEIELAQAITPRDPDATVTSVDALVRTMLPASAHYVVSSRLLTNVAGQGCWSRERPIQARVRQFARRYQRQAGGDWAVIHQRTDGLELDPEQWTALLDGEIPRIGYCDAYE